MRTIELPWETWRAVIAVLREKALPYMLDHADHIERQLEQHGPGEATVRLSLTDDVFLRSYNWALAARDLANGGLRSQTHAMRHPRPHRPPRRKVQVVRSNTDLHMDRHEPGPVAGFVREGGGESVASG